MRALPSSSVPLVDADGMAQTVLLGVLPDLSASIALTKPDGTATDYFRRYLSDKVRPLPNAPLANPDGTPTRIFTLLLAGMDP